MIQLSKKSARQIIRIIGSYQNYLEDVIDSAIAPGEREPRDPSLTPAVAADRRRWREAENLVGQLDGMLKRKRARKRKAAS